MTADGEIANVDRIAHFRISARPHCVLRGFALRSASG
jgi:hypothetical protein